LNGASFARADLRGADFGNASLVDANFTDARVGLSPLFGVVLLAAAIVLAAMAGGVVGWMATETRSRIFSGEWQPVMAGFMIIVLTLVLFGFAIAKGLYGGVKAFMVTFLVLLVVDVTVAALFGEVNVALMARTLGLVVLFVLALVAGILARMVGGAFSPIAITFVAVIGGIAAGRADGGIGAIIVSLLLVYLSKRALHSDLRDRPMLALMGRIITIGGTKFTGANLAGANFTGVKALRADFTDAQIAETVWDPEHLPIQLVPDSSP
jgi:hypothetical protein